MKETRVYPIVFEDQVDSLVNELTAEEWTLFISQADYDSYTLIATRGEEQA